MPFWVWVTHSALTKSDAVGEERAWAEGGGPKAPYTGVRFVGLRRMFSFGAVAVAVGDVVCNGMPALTAICVTPIAAAVESQSD